MKNIAGPLHNPNGITQNPILDNFWPKWKTNCKVSKKNNEQFPKKRYAQTHGRTDVQTNGQTQKVKLKMVFCHNLVNTPIWDFVEGNNNTFTDCANEKMSK